MTKQKIKNIGLTLCLSILLGSPLWATTLYEKMDTELNNLAKETGYLKFLPIGGAGGGYLFFPGNSVNKGNTTQAKKIDTLYGGAGGFLVNLNTNWAIGGLFGGMGGGSETKIGPQYDSYSVGAAFQLVNVRYKWIKTENWFIDIDMGIGMIEGGYQNYSTDESSVLKEQQRFGTSLATLIATDLRYRITPLSFIGLKVGYFSGALKDLERGGEKVIGSKIDFSQPFLAFTMGGNF